jgi:hypothetical protein
MAARDKINPWLEDIIGGLERWPMQRTKPAELKQIVPKPGQQPPKTLHLEQRKHCKRRNSNLRPLQFLRVNR